MKKLFYMLSILIVAMGCDKQSEIQADSSSTDGIGDVVEFSLSSLTRANDKVDWEEGDLIAIFTMADNQYSEPYYYTVGAEDCLDVYGAGEPVVFDGLTQVYYAFYAGDAMLGSYEEYAALKSIEFSETDCLSSFASGTSGAEVELTFEHIYAKVTFNLNLYSASSLWTDSSEEGIYISYDAKIVLSSDDTQELFSDLIVTTDITNYYTCYVAPTTSLISKGVVFNVTTVYPESETSTTETGCVLLGYYDEIPQWESGESYTYDINVKIETLE